MLRSLKSLEDYAVSATDGDIGSVRNFLLDDERWVVRYLVVEEGGFLGMDRRVLISPISFRQVDWSTHRFRLALTSDKIAKSPSVDTDEPVSRQHERDYYRYYGYPCYWGYSGAWGMGAYPGVLASGVWNEPRENQMHGSSGDLHLRSAREVRGYHIQGNDGGVGHIHDFIVDDETWEIRYLVIDTSNWWLGRKVLVSPHWANHVSWAERKVYVDISRQAIKNSPEWNADAGINREFEANLYDYYGRPVYWGAPVEKPKSSQQSGSHPA